MTFVHAHLVWIVVSASVLALGAGVSTAVLVGRRSHAALGARHRRRRRARR